MMKRQMWLWMLGMVWVLMGCQKELCYNHDEHSMAVRIDVNTSWVTIWERDYGCIWTNNWETKWGYTYDDLRPHTPEGVRLTAYPNEGAMREYNLPPQGQAVTLDKEGIYSLLLYNNDTEYIVYDGMISSTRATATTRTVSRGGFRTLHEGERTINQPDMLYGKYIEDYLATKQAETALIDAQMNPLVYTYLIRYEFKAGRKYVALARGAIAGMAEKVYLHDGHTGPESATILFDCKLNETGIEAKVMTFGVPDFPGDHYNRGEEENNRYALNLEVKLTNGNDKWFEFDITDQLKNQPRGGVIIVPGLEVTPEEGESPEVGGGFDIDVDGWGNAIDIPLEF